jgi:hypothetical protein
MKHMFTRFVVIEKKKIPIFFFSITTNRVGISWGALCQTFEKLGMTYDI